MRYFIAVLLLGLSSSIIAQGGVPLGPFETILEPVRGSETLLGGAFDGERWLVTWHNHDPSYFVPSRTMSSFVASDGTFEARADVGVSSRGVSAFSARVGWNGERFLVAYGLTVSRTTFNLLPIVAVEAVEDDGTSTRIHTVISETESSARVIGLERFADEWLVSWASGNEGFSYMWLDIDGNPVTDVIDVEAGHALALVRDGSRPVWITLEDGEIVGTALESGTLVEIDRTGFGAEISALPVSDESGIWITARSGAGWTLLRLTDHWTSVGEFQIQTPRTMAFDDGELWIVHDAPGGYGAVVYDPVSGSSRTVELFSDLDEGGCGVRILQSNEESLLVVCAPAESGEGSDLYAVPFRADLTDVESLSLISASITGGQEDAMTAADDQNLVVAWEQYLPATNRWATVVRSFAPDMTPVTDPIIFPYELRRGDIACSAGRCIVVGTLGVGGQAWTIVDLNEETVQPPQPMESLFGVRAAATPETFLIVWRTQSGEIRAMATDRSGNPSTPFPVLPDGIVKTGIDVASCGDRIYLSWIQEWNQNHDNAMLAELSAWGIAQSVVRVGDRQKDYSVSKVACNEDEVVVTWGETGGGTWFNAIVEGKL
ncbi:MAG: hypothetical protein KY432_12360, partial [Acidobacteria bacterium]|nr:hypothetical protein [Acidobacteriota bacterium]